MKYALRRPMPAGFTGTFLPVFIGAGAVVVNEPFGGPLSGASLNPAGSFGPALASGTTGVLWNHLVAPVLGAALAVPGCRAMRGRERCR